MPHVHGVRMPTEQFRSACEQHSEAVAGAGGGARDARENDEPGGESEPMEGVPDPTHCAGGEDERANGVVGGSVYIQCIQ